MDLDIQQLVDQGLRPIDIQFLSVKQLTQLYEHFGVDYVEADKVPKEAFATKLIDALTAGDHFAKPVVSPAERELHLQNERIRLEVEKAKLEAEREKAKAQADLERIKLEGQLEVEKGKMLASQQEAKAQAEVAQLLLKKEMLELELKIKQEGGDPDATPRATINTNVLPHFDEEDPENFFSQFEKIAYHWPKEMWPILVQTHFKGKAREAFANLDAAASKEYERVKEAVLLAYELNAEAYRQKFRQSRMDSKMNYVEFASLKTKEFGKWVAAAKIESYEDLVETVLVEEFLGKIPLEVRQYLSDKSGTLTKLAQMADTFALTKKLGKGSGPQPPGTGKNPQFEKKTRAHCTKCGRWGPTHERCPDDVKRITCPICKEKGHYSTVCPKRKSVGALGVSKKNNGKEETTKSVGYVETEEKHEKIFFPYLYPGYISPTHRGRRRKYVILRDTGAAQSLILRSALKGNSWKFTGEHTICRGLGDQRVSVPLVFVYLRCRFFSGKCVFGVVDSLPVHSAQLLIGNDVAHGSSPDTPVMCNQVIPCLAQDESWEAEIFPACAVTRSQSRGETSAKQKPQRSEDMLVASAPVHLDRVTLPEEQARDSSLEPCFQGLQGTAKTPGNIEYLMQNGVLIRKWTSPTSSSAHLKGDVIQQVVLPKGYRSLVLETAHCTPMSGHLGIKSTYEKILRHFFWPGLREDVASFCKSCLICQQVGKRNQKIPPAHLHPIPCTGDPFSDIIIDFVGPLPKTKSGKQYLLTIMCKATRYPEAFALSSTRSCHAINSLTNFFAHVGLPTTVQSDNGSSFVSDEFEGFLKQYGINHVLSTPYRPQSQGALERYHQTLKTMLTKFCLANRNLWDRYVPLLLFCTRDTVQESLGFSPFQLVFGHKVRGPLSVLKSQCLNDSQAQNLLERVEDYHAKLKECRDLAGKNMERSQSKMKAWFDRKAVKRSFSPGELCLIFLPIAKGALSAKFFGPYKVLEKVSDLTYRVATPDRGRQQRVCHVNQMKEFIGPRDDDMVVATVQVQEVRDESTEIVVPRLANSEIMADLQSYLSTVPKKERAQVEDLLKSFPEVFTDKLGRTNLLVHDVELIDETPVRQRPYRTSPVKAKIMSEEVEFLVSEGLATPTEGEWASPCILVPKPDGSSRFCVDYRLCNKQIKSDAFPMPRLLDCIDQVGEAQYISKLDLLKGYWQVPLTPRARQVYSFVTGDGLFSFDVLPFGCKNAPACFQRLMTQVVKGIPKVSCYLDDIIVFSNTLSEHLDQLTQLLEALRSANLVVNLAKSEFLQSSVEYLGHVVGHGQVAPKQANVESVLNMPPPSDLKGLRRFLGAAGFYRRFCKNFSSVCFPLTNLLKKGQKFKWDSDCQQAFEDIKAMLSFSPVLKSPDFSKPFTLYTDASGYGVGGVLMQNDAQGIERPVSYFSRKLNKHQLNYAPIEKECLAIILSITHFSIYLNNGHTTTVFTDHNPLAFLAKMKEKNQKLLRWSLLLQEYDLQIQHVKGSENVIADMLSRS